MGARGRSCALCRSTNIVDKEVRGALDVSESCACERVWAGGRGTSAGRAEDLPHARGCYICRKIE